MVKNKSPKPIEPIEKKIIIPKKPLSDYTDLGELRRIRVNALNAGAHEYAELVQQRIWELFGTGSDSLDEAFLRTLATYESLLFDKHQKNVKAQYIRRMLAKHGTIESLKRAVMSKGKLSSGFITLIQAGHADLTAESLVIKNADKFEPNVVQRAKEKIEQAKLI